MVQQSRSDTRVGKGALDQPVNLNTAGREELRAVEGLGEARVERILEWRRTHGAFRSVDELQRLLEARADEFERLRRQLTI